MTSFFQSVSILSSQSRVFGCSAFVHVHGRNQGKLDPQAIKCLFTGHASHKRGYKCYHPPSRLVYISMDVTFQETESFYPSPQLQGESSQEAKSPMLSVIPLIHEPLMSSSIPTTEDNGDNVGDDNDGDDNDGNDDDGAE